MFLVTIGKITSFISNITNIGSGSTWPGHIALFANKNFIKDIVKQNSHLKTILIAGTNGKTTTGKLTRDILEKSKKKVLQNAAGANLLNGIASSLILNSNSSGKINKDFAIFEVDENTLPLILKEITNPDFIVVLNLFRDQLDRYGEVNIIFEKWRDALKKLPCKTTFILNADDPQIALLGLDHIVEAKPIPYRKRSSNQVFYFGLDDKKVSAKNPQHAVDSAYCPRCETKLTYTVTYYSHLGIWKCDKCKSMRPKLDIKKSPAYPLSGIYNRYNTLASVLLAKKIGVKQYVIENALKNFKPAFGRQEILEVNEKKVQIFLSKNPTSFNESLKTVAGLDARNLLIVLNDRIPDGRDVSWVWDIDFEDYIDKFRSLIVSGDRAYDMGLRLKYTQGIIHESLFIIQENLKDAVALALQKTPKSETLCILPTYSAMLEVRKILTGKKIL